jgi:prepilin peptidase CpaA
MLFAEWIMTSLSENGVFWFVSLFCVVAAYIDGTQLKVPNAITFPMIIAGWLYSSFAYGMAGEGWYLGLLWSIGGTAVGLACLYPFYAIGGMGGGDVKMLAAVGAWVHSSMTISAFFLSAFIGGLMAILMIVFSKSATKHYYQFFGILNEKMHNQISLIYIPKSDSLGEFKIIVLLIYPDVFGDMVYGDTCRVYKIDEHLTHLIGHHFQIITNRVSEQLGGFGLNLMSQFFKIALNPFV